MADFSIVLTLKPYMYVHAPKTQFSMTEDELWKACQGYKCTFIAELTKEYNIHYHGIIYFEDGKHRARWLNRLRKCKSFGRKYIENIVNDKLHMDYIAKDIALTESIIEQFPVVRDSYDVLLRKNELIKYFKYDEEPEGQHIQVPMLE